MAKEAAKSMYPMESFRNKETPMVTVRPKDDPSLMMKAVEWFGAEDVRVVQRPRPRVTDPSDVVLKITTSAICGSDLHLYLNAAPGMKKHDVMGHEFMGTVEEVGPDVKSVKTGDRVLVAFPIACGQCFYCMNKLYSCCDNTNPSPEQEALYGHRTSGIYGYTHLTGGWQGGQAEYARVPFADVNTMQIPDDVPDESAVLLADILPTAWHATEMGQVGEGDRVAIWGAGPVGTLVAHCCKARGASRIVLIDQENYRLQHAVKCIPGLETINFKEKPDVKAALEELLPGGPDVGIEAVGFHYAKSLAHKLEMALKLETDPSEIINEMIKSVRKGGRISIVGVYVGYCNHFNIGAFMEKGMSMAAGQTPVQRYWKKLLEMVRAGTLDPKIVVTHQVPLDAAAMAYKQFNEKERDTIKVLLKPGLTGAPAGATV